MTNGSAGSQLGHGDRPRVVVVGAGFGGLEAARKLARSPVDVTVIDRRNYHLFQPLLYQVATAALSPADIAQPIRAVLRDQQNATVLLDEVIGVDVAARRVETRFGADQSYDYLILATGSQYAYFGHDEWPRLAPGLKSIDDATLIRRRVLFAFEEAENVTASRWPERSSNLPTRHCLVTFATSIPTPRTFCWSRLARVCCRASRRG
jgi:NADH dehydrogenase